MKGPDGRRPGGSSARISATNGVTKSGYNVTLLPATGAVPIGSSQHLQRARRHPVSSTYFRDRRPGDHKRHGHALLRDRHARHDLPGHGRLDHGPDHSIRDGQAGSVSDSIGDFWGRSLATGLRPFSVLGPNLDADRRLGYNSYGLMSKSASRLALVCALVGLGASIAAAYVHYHLMFDPTYTSFCDVNATVSCTQVYLSPYSTVRGIPVAIFGAIWFAAAALLTVTGMVARGNVRESVPGYLFAASTLALAVVLYFEYVSFVVLKAVCILCLVMAAAVVALFFLSGSTTPFPMTTLHRRALRDLRALVSSPLALLVTVLFLGGAASTLAFFPREAPVATGAAAAGDPAATAAGTVAAGRRLQRRRRRRCLSSSVTGKRGRRFRSPFPPKAPRC